MENTESIDDNFNETRSELSGETWANFKAVAGWGQFLSILGFIGLAFMVLAVLGVSSMGGMRMRGDGFLLILIYLIVAAIYFFPIFFMYKFSMKFKDAVQTKSIKTFEEGSQYLKYHYQFIGVITIIVLSIYILSFVTAMVSFM